jgi:hypothetical protein
MSRGRKSSFLALSSHLVRRQHAFATFSSVASPSVTPASCVRARKRGNKRLSVDESMQRRKLHLHLWRAVIERLSSLAHVIDEKRAKNRGEGSDVAATIFLDASLTAAR